MTPAPASLPDQLADAEGELDRLREKVRILTIQNNARATIIAGHQSMGWDRRAEDLARVQLDSQREANARLTDEVETLQFRLTAAEAERDAAIRERDEARADQKAAEDQKDALHVKLKALAPHGSCACSYDHPDDTCMHHSPALSAALARAERAEKALEPFAEAADNLEALAAQEGFKAGEYKVVVALAALLDARAALADGKAPKTEGEA